MTAFLLNQRVSCGMGTHRKTNVDIADELVKPSRKVVTRVIISICARKQYIRIFCG